MEDKASLEHQIKALTKEVSKFELENTIYRKFLEKKTSINDDDFKRKKKNKIKNLPISLTIDQKVELVNTVNNHYTNEISTNHIKNEKMLDSLRSILEETDIRISEIKCYSFEFKRDVITVNNTKLGDKNNTEKIEKFFNDKANHTDHTIEKLKLKNVTLKVQVNKQEQQISLEESAGESLQYIDFHQLQIENKQNSDTLHERNKELIQLKQSTAKIIQILNDVKLNLIDKCDEQQWLSSEVASKTKAYEKLRKDKLRSTHNMRRHTQSMERLASLLSQSNQGSVSTSTVNMEDTSLISRPCLLEDEHNSGGGHNSDAALGSVDSVKFAETLSISEAPPPPAVIDALEYGDHVDLEADEEGHNSDPSGDGGITLPPIVKSSSDILKELPQVQDFIDQKRVMYELQEGIATWTRKLEIVELAAKNLKIRI